MRTSTSTDAQEHHGIGFYIVIFAILIVLTALTWWTGQMNLGVFNLPLALLIATTKATLVVLFFMHLLEHRGTAAMVFAVSVFFVVLLLLGIFGDSMTRWRHTNPPETNSPGSAIQQHAPGAVPSAYP